MIFPRYVSVKRPKMKPCCSLRFKLFHGRGFGVYAIQMSAKLRKSRQEWNWPVVIDVIFYSFFVDGKNLLSLHIYWNHTLCKRFINSISQGSKQFSLAEFHDFRWDFIHSGRRRRLNWPIIYNILLISCVEVGAKIVRCFSPVKIALFLTALVFGGFFSSVKSIN